MYNILVCDDDKEIVEAIEIYLSQEGYKVLKAYDGEEALKLLDKHKVDLLIIDVMMPRLDGIRATLKIREKQNLQSQRMPIRSSD
jgi:DNA-binding response OmpR family regulator